MIPWCAVSSRAFIGIHGPERIEFLDGLCTQKISATEPVFSALLTPQGRFFADFFVRNTDSGLILECAKTHHATLMNLLHPYARLHNVTIHDYSTRYGVCAALSEGAKTLWQQSPFYPENNSDVLVFIDPRHPDLGLRAWIPYALWNQLPHPYLNPCLESTYHHHRIHLGVPEGAYDLVHQNSIILEYGYQHIQAISWTKGCYMGQELMARTFHRGTVRKHLYRSALQEGTFPESGEILLCASDQTRLGWMGSHHQTFGLMVLHESFCSQNPGCDVISLCTPDAPPFCVKSERIHTL